jgi:hypothetical protein
VEAVKNTKNAAERTHRTGYQGAGYQDIKKENIGLHLHTRCFPEGRKILFSTFLLSATTQLLL